MKKSKNILIVLIAAIIGFLAGAIGMRMCGNVDSRVETDAEDLDSEDLKEEDMVAYYGCPNSRRVKKLNLLKSRRVL